MSTLSDNVAERPVRAASDIVVPLIIRGEVIEHDLVEFGARGDELSFLSPDPHKYLARIPLQDPGRLADLHRCAIDEIVDFLVAVGERLGIDDNVHMQAARALSYAAAPTTEPLVDEQYRLLPSLFTRRNLEDILEYGIDRRYLDGWVQHELCDGRTQLVHAFGSRVVHISAGNGTLGAAIGIIRSALTRGDAIMKSPSNDPLTAAAIARTICELDPTHPVARHLTVAYWRGGDQEFEAALYRPQNVEKIVAWGGYASIKHVVRYLQPGLELVQFDPKRSISIVDLSDADSSAAVDDAAQRLATDIGMHNQQGCTSARVVFVVTGTDDAGVERLDDFGDRTYKALLALPQHVSTAPKGGINADLRSSLDAARLSDDFYRVVGGQDDEGALIMSRLPAPVDFAEILTDRVANLVPVDSIDEAFAFFDLYTQTVGIYPPELRTQLRERVGLQGAQRITTLGHSTFPTFTGPQDALEPLRRLCRWVTEEAR